MASKQELRKLGRKKLRELAARAGLQKVSRWSKDRLVAALADDVASSPGAADRPSAPTEDEPASTSTVYRRIEREPWQVRTLQREQRVAVLPLDQRRVHVFWVLEERAVRAARGRVSGDDTGLWLRLEVSAVDPRGRTLDAEQSFAVETLSGNWYADAGVDGATVTASLELRSARGETARLIRSQPVSLPRGEEAREYAEEFAELHTEVDVHWRPRGVPQRSPPEPEPARVPEPALPAQAPVAEEWAVGADLPLVGVEPEQREVVLATVEEVAHAPVAESEAAWIEPEPVQSEEDLHRSRLEHLEHFAEAEEGALRSASVAADLDAMTPLPVETSEPASEGESLARPPWQSAGPGTSSASFSSESLLQGSLNRRPRLEIQADLILYGRADPDTEVVIDGIPVRVAGDGSFELRLALPGRPAVSGEENHSGTED